MDTSASDLEHPQIVMDSLRRIVQALRQSSTQSEQSIGLTAAQLLVLKRIHAQDGLSVNELAALTFTHQSTVSEVVGRLEVKGLVTRSRTLEDARRVAVFLTDAGTAALASSAPSAHDRLMQAVTRLPPDTLAHLAHGLDALIQAAHLSDQSPDMFFETKTPSES